MIVKISKINREVMILNTLRPQQSAASSLHIQNHIVGLREVALDAASNTPTLVFDLIDTGGVDFREAYKGFNGRSLREYMRQVL